MLSNYTVFAAEKTTWANCTVDGVPTLKCLEVVFGNILTAASALIIITLFIMFVVGAFTYLTSLGNPERVKKAQAVFRYAITGFLLFLAAFLILRTIDFLFLGGSGSLFQLKIGE